MACDWGVEIFELVTWAYSKTGFPPRPVLIPDAAKEQLKCTLHEANIGNRLGMHPFQILLVSGLL